MESQLSKEHSHTDSNDEKKTGLILAAISLSLTSCFVFWLSSEPMEFVHHRLGINEEAFRHPLAWFLALATAVGYILYTLITLPFVRARVFTISWLKWIGIWAALVASTVEEIFFRQVLMDWLQSVGSSIILQILISGIVFGVAHGAWVSLRGEWKIALPVILATTILGSLLAVVYIVADRNILAPIVAHILINLVIEPWLMLSAVTGKWAN